MPFERNDKKNQNSSSAFEKKVSSNNEKAETSSSKGTDSKIKIEFSLTEPKYSMTELVLTDKALDEINTVVNSQRCWSKVFDEWGMKEILHQKKSILVNLYGESGTGKTMAAHAIAKKLGKKLVCVNYADIESKYVGETSKNLTAIFSYAALNDALLFFDEADALLSRRVTNMTNSTDVSVNQTRSVLLTLMNDYEGMVIFTTNFISNFDPAFMRRIQYHIHFELPNAELREKLWRRYIPGKMPAEINVQRIAEKYDRVSGSDISNAVLRAALKAARLNEDVVKEAYFCEAIESIISSKSANSQTGNVVITKRPVTEEYALSQINKKQEDKK